MAVTGSSFIVAGAGGVLPTVPCHATETPGQRCSHDFAALTHLAAKIKQHNPDERRVHITADARVPYAVVVRTMDALRGRSTGRCTGQDGCLFDRVVFAAGVK